MNDMTTDTPDIEFRDVRYTYPGGGEALRGLSFRVGRGEKVAILGPNGAGKSTMLLHTNGLLLPSAAKCSPQACLWSARPSQKCAAA